MDLRRRDVVELSSCISATRELLERGGSVRLGLLPFSGGEGADRGSLPPRQLADPPVVAGGP
ncbi:hypothetical protein ACPA9J_07935 [Pseudomonas aeruginosa]